MAKLADGLITLTLVLLGLVLMATPLALWVAWTDTVLLLVLAAGITAGALYCVLVYLEKPVGDGARSLRTRLLSDEAVADLQDLHPFIHHHQPSGGPKFLSAMRRLRKRLD